MELGEVLKVNDKNRKGSWIQTYSGQKFWPLDARPEEVNVEDNRLNAVDIQGLNQSEDGASSVRPIN